MSTILTILILVLTLIGVAAGEFPLLRMNRATIALVGAAALLIVGAITLEEAYAAVDMNTIVLLFAMMVINANLRLAGFFQVVTRGIVRRARSTRLLLALIILASGLLSALFLNDTIVLMFTPLVVDITARLRRDPIPYLIALVAAANIGSAATIVGNPQNMIIGTASGISFVRFSAALLPPSLAGLGVVWLVLVLLYRNEFTRRPLLLPEEEGVQVFKPLLWKGLVGVAGMLAAMLAGAPVPLAALGAAAFLLFTRRVKPGRVFREVDAALLVFFAALFVVTGAIETSGLTEHLFRLVRPLAEQGVAALAGVALVLSNLVSNVPAVLLFRPLVPLFPDPEQAWLTLAMATTYAGNLTLLGSVANLIVAESAAARGVKIVFREYLRAGVPITLISLALGVLWMGIR